MLLVGMYNTVIVPVSRRKGNNSQSDHNIGRYLARYNCSANTFNSPRRDFGRILSYGRNWQKR